MQRMVDNFELERGRKYGTYRLPSQTNPDDSPF